MGASIGAVAFKVNTAEFTLQRVVQDLFGEAYVAVAGHCDTRNEHCVFAGKTAEWMIIGNTPFTDRFFKTQDTSAIEKYLAYFRNPELVFAFEEYDSGGSYGYSLIYDGVLKRQVRTISYEKTIDFGEPDKIESDWITANGVEEEDSEEELVQALLQELMANKLGFTTWNMDEYMLEQCSFKKQAV